MTIASLNIFSPKPSDTTDNPRSSQPAVLPNIAPTPSHPGANPPPSAGSAAYVPQSAHPVSGIIGPRMIVTGDIEFEGELMIQGKVTGNVRSVDEGKGILRIEEKAEVTGDVDVFVLKVSGTLKGTVSAKELLHLHPTGMIIGPIKYKNIQLDSGGTLEGSLTPEFKNARG